MSLSWDLRNVGVNSDLSIIAFIQSNNSDANKGGQKEIYQAIVRSVTTDDAVTTGFGNGIDEVYNMYPNPADQEVFVVFNERVKEQLNWFIFDQTGRIFERGTLNAGSTGMTLNVKDYPSGLYFISMNGENTNLKSRKIMITH